jgi:hypothetical protein
MQSKQAIKWMVLVPLALLLAVTGIGTADEPLAIQPSAISCGDSATCSTAGSSVKVQNSGAGTAILGQHTWAGKGVEGNSNRGVGVKGSSNRAAGVKGWSWAGNGVAGISELGYGVNAYSASSFALYAVSEAYRGGYFRGAGDLHPDLILGGNSDSEDAGALMSDPAYASSDIVIYSLDDVAIHLDENGGDAGAFTIVETNNNALLTTTEDGHLYVARDLYLDEWGSGLGRVIAIDTSSADLGLVANGDIDAHLDNNGGDAACFYIREHGDSVIWSACEAKGMTVSGASAMAVETGSGAREMYAVGSPELWFEDFGSAALVDGQAVVSLDPLFAETVNLDETYHVFIQVYGDAEVYVSNRTPTHFEVHLRDGDPNVEFSYRIVAKRLGHESQRLEQVDLAPTVEAAP